MGKPGPFLALTSAALALPALAATQPVESTVSVKAGNYREGDISRSDVLAGSDERYDIDTAQFSLLVPLASAWSIGIGVTTEYMTGASPWYGLLGEDGEADLIMSGATIRDDRTEVSISLGHYRQTSSYEVALSQSREDDYNADAISLSAEFDFNQRLSTLSLGFSYSSDDIEPQDAARFGRVASAKKQSRSISLGWTQVINRTSLIQAALDITDHDGYLSDPYKLLDRRPDQKHEWALSLKYRHYFDNRNAALHLDYRYYNDDWGAESHTLYTAWYKNLLPGFKLAPNVRYYSQSEADFYRIATDFLMPSTVEQSTDFRLSGYGAWTFGLKGVYETTDWTLSVSIDRYISDRSYGHSGSDNSHPAELNFLLSTIGLEYRF